jgi:Uma2 family endonuclease
MSTVSDVDIEHQPLSEEEIAAFYAEMARLVTEDDKPMDNIFSEKQQRLLTEPLYAAPSFPGGERPFVAMANVGLFYGMRIPPVVPDMLLSLDVQLPKEVWSKHHRAYFTWMYNKPPEIAIEVVSNTEGEELGSKRELYAQIGIWFYVVFDPNQALKHGVLQVFELQRRSYVERDSTWFPELGLGLAIWHGSYEGLEAGWLRWCYENGTVVPSGAERADQERERADQERERADQERARAERLAARLRALGIEPEE